MKRERLWKVGLKTQAGETTGAHISSFNCRSAIYRHPGLPGQMPLAWRPGCRRRTPIDKVSTWAQVQPWRRHGHQLTLTKIVEGSESCYDNGCALLRLYVTIPPEVSNFVAELSSLGVLRPRIFTVCLSCSTFSGFFRTVTGLT
jgi:hypothetical protein